MKTRVSTCAISDLNSEQSEYLKRVTVDPTKAKDPIAIYVEIGDGFAFVADACITLKQKKSFDMEAPAGLWLTGATGAVRTRGGLLAIWDDRYRWYKSAPIGWAGPEDGNDLMNTARREFSEEIVAFSLDRKWQFVPKGVKAALEAPCIGVTGIGASLEWGELVPLRFHKKERIVVLHCEWDIRALEEQHSLTIVSDDEWWQGGYFGSPLVTLGEHGQVTGYYAGQQGYVDLTAPLKYDDDIEVLLGLR